MASTRLFAKAQRPRLIGMVHLKALPGTPMFRGKFNQILDQALKETEILDQLGMDAIIVENMNDLPYVQEVGPEILTSMTAISSEIRKTFDQNKPVGVQVLAGANKGALAVALAAGLQFIRAESFVFAHVADEGWMNAQAGQLLRYRKAIGAEHIRVFTDVKKKHCAHNVTSDVSIGETAEAAKFFLADGLIVTGSATGAQADPSDLKDVLKATKSELPVLIGSGITPQNVHLFADAHGFIVGSYLKKLGNWKEDIDSERVRNIVEAVKNLK